MTECKLIIYMLGLKFILCEDPLDETEVMILIVLELMVFALYNVTKDFFK